MLTLMSLRKYSTMQLIQQLKGHSGANVVLVEDNNVYKVIKTNFSKAIESAYILEHLPFPTPEIYHVEHNKLEMEYIQGQDMKTYLENASYSEINKLTDFICNYIDYCIFESTDYNFSLEIEEKLDSLSKHIDVKKVTPTSSVFPRSLIHGDFTLENILFSNNKFYLIDSNPTNLNSIVFDANKLRQDIDGLWFIRNTTNKLNISINCSKISKTLKDKYDFIDNDSLYRFMIGRILPYCKDQFTTDFITKEIERTWQ